MKVCRVKANCSVCHQGMLHEHPDVIEADDWIIERLLAMEPSPVEPWPVQAVDGRGVGISDKVQSHPAEKPAPQAPPTPKRFTRGGAKR